MPYKDMVYGTEHRKRNKHDDDITDLGKMAVRGVVTVGVVGATAGLMGGILGSFPKT